MAARVRRESPGGNWPNPKRKKTKNPMKPRGDGSTNFVSNEEKKVQQAATEGKSSSSFFFVFL